MVNLIVVEILVLVGQENIEIIVQNAISIMVPEILVRAGLGDTDKELKS